MTKKMVIKNKTNTKVFRKESDIVAAVREMRAHKKGEISLETRAIKIPEKIDVALIRKNFGFTQKEFAEHYGFTVSSVKEWEQGRREPERSAKLFLKVIAAEPKIVERILRK